MQINTIKESYNAEVALIILCCRHFLQTADKTSVQLFLQENEIDWKQFYQLSAAHRIRTVVYKVLSQFKDLINPEYLLDFRNYTMYFNAFALNNKKELNKILYLLKQKNIAGKAFKGVDFAENIYGEIGLREFSDNDIIIKDSDIHQVIEIMTSEGYQSKDVGFYKKFPKQYIRDYKDLLFEKSNGAVREFAFEFHFKPSRAFQGYLNTFLEVLGKDYLEENSYSKVDYLKLMTLNNGLMDFYPNIRSILDLAVILKQMQGSTPDNIDIILSAYVDYGKQISFGLLNFPPQPLTMNFNKSEIKFCNYLQKNIMEMKEGTRNTVLKYMYFNIKNSVSLPRKISLAGKLMRLIVTPNIADFTTVKFPYFFLYYFTKPFRIINKSLNLKRRRITRD